MLKNHKMLRMVLVVFVIALLVTYALIVFLPHGHECLDVGCAVCNMMEFFRDVLFSVALLGAAQLITSSIFNITVAYAHSLPFSEKTPVGLRVKLSD